MNEDLNLTAQQINQNIHKIQNFLEQENLDGIYFSSHDEYLNEYVPLRDCHRYFYTGFTGSTAECFVPKNGKVKLFVDGRYHEQADLECDLERVDVIKVSHATSLSTALLEELDQLGVRVIACEGDRTSVEYYEMLRKKFQLNVISSSLFKAIYQVAKAPPLKPIKQVSTELCGLSVGEKISQIIKNDHEAYFITATDSLAWITNCRGHHLPHLSSFLGKGVLVKDKVFVFIQEEIEIKCEDEQVEFVVSSPDILLTSFKRIMSEYGIKKIFIDRQMANASDYIMLEQIAGAKTLEHIRGGLATFHAIKNAGEIQSIKSAFKRADKAIYNTICWVKQSVGKGEKVSERDIYLKTAQMYQEQGAVEQSFGTISGIDANSSIIHYGDPKKDILATEQSMVLLDSGGYFEAGFATDTTRTFMAADKEGRDKHKRMYTLVLKAMLNLQNAVFRETTGGAALDILCRQSLYQEGLDFAHGTGHGVGIHVHESGAGISARNYRMKVGQVVSIEPGLYEPGFGGVRIENIALVIEHPQYDNFLTFEPLVYIGLEPKLINESLLNAQEKKWLESYEAECAKRGTSFC